eukprot:UN27283
MAQMSLPEITHRPLLEFLTYLCLAITMALAEYSYLDFVPHVLLDTVLIILAGTLGSVITYGSKNSELSNQVESISTSDAAKFPFVASLALFGLYTTFKLVPDDYITPLISVYFTAIGWICMATLFRNILNTMINGENGPLVKPLFYISYPSINVFGMFDLGGMWVHTTKPNTKEDVTTLDLLNIILFIAAAPLAWKYYLTKHWILNNIIGIGFCVEAIKWVRPGSFKTVALLLSALFFYDIFWVFGTEVMVTVATKFDGPIKLLFPKLAGTRPSLLGLGDIVLPAF